MVAAWINADTGVGPAIASGNHTNRGICALFPVAPMKSRNATDVMPPAKIACQVNPSNDILPTVASALVTPAASIRGLSSGNPWVLKVDDNHASRQPIKVGLVSGGKAEILDGLGEGDIVVPASYTVDNGARIRARVAPAREP